MKIEFSILSTKKDWLAFKKIYDHFTYRKKRYLQVFLLLVLFLILVSLAFYLNRFILQYNEHLSSRLIWQIARKNLFFISFFITCLILFIRLLYRYSFSLKKARKASTDHPLNRYLLEKQMFSIDPDSIRIKTETSDTTFAWRHVVKVVETQDYLALFFNLLDYRLLPKHQLNPHQIEGLHQLLKTYFRGESFYL
ncbi:YcxB family protein [Enterococcus faecalis]